MRQTARSFCLRADGIGRKPDLQAVQDHPRRGDLGLQRAEIGDHDLLAEDDGPGLCEIRRERIVAQPLERGQRAGL